MLSAAAPVMCRDLAIIVERDPALRRLMQGAVERSNYDVIQCSNPLQLKVELRSARLVDTPELLLISSVDVAKQCTVELGTLFRLRSSAGRAAVHAAFTCEFGAPQELPIAGSYIQAGILEKPFQLDELERIARACQRSVGTSESSLPQDSAFARSRPASE